MSEWRHGGRARRMGATRGWILAASTLLLGLGATSVRGAPGPCTVDPVLPDPLYVEMATSLGAVLVELWPDVAPCSVNNFLAYVESGRYDGTFIHRTVDSFVIQGGGFFYDAPSDSFASILRDPSVLNEPGASNLRGTIAMARVGGQVDSATSEFFVNLADNVFLDSVDEGFTVFGAVLEPSMDVVDAIAALPRVEGRFVLSSPLRNIFGALPVQVAPVEPPGGLGCLDPAALPRLGSNGWLRALVNEGGDALVADPVAGGPFLLSRGCDGSGAIAPPSVSCSTGRAVAFSSDEVTWLLDPVEMSCAAIAESEESLAARRDHFHPQVTSALVEVSRVEVPEPAQPILLAAGVAALGGLARLRSRTVSHH